LRRVVWNLKKGLSVPLYEHVFLARQDISQAQVDALVKEYGEVIAEGGGKVGKTEYWGVKPLAYKIKKNRKAHFSLMNLDAPPAAVAEMERRMALSPDVIRFITIRVDAHETEPSIQMRKSDRDDRRDGDRGGGFRGDRGGGGFRGGDRGAARVATAAVAAGTGVIVLATARAATTAIARAARARRAIPTRRRATSNRS
jgi:small subunit ribosomal protein S6